MERYPKGMMDQGIIGDTGRFLNVGDRYREGEYEVVHATDRYDVGINDKIRDFLDSKLGKSKIAEIVKNGVMNYIEKRVGKDGDVGEAFGFTHPFWADVLVRIDPQGRSIWGLRDWNALKKLANSKVTVEEIERIMDQYFP